MKISMQPRRMRRLAARTVLVLAGLLVAPMAAGTAQSANSDSVVRACSALDTTTAWQKIDKAWANDSGRRWTNDGLRQRLLALEEADQSIRRGLSVDSMSDSGFAARMMASDSRRAAEMREIVRRYGWPTRTMVGAAGARAAFLIVQHNGGLQHEMLRRMRTLPAGEVSPGDLAMLDDRVRVSDGLPQRYGTQASFNPDKPFGFDPIEDVEHLDERRAKVGMPPMTIYLCVMRGIYGRDLPDPRLRRR